MRQHLSKEMALDKGLQNAYQFSGVMFPEKNYMFHFWLQGCHTYVADSDAG
jgi:hypothetical protein